MGYSQVVIGKTGKKMVQRMVSQAQRTNHLREPVPGNVGRIEELIQMRNRASFIVIAMSGQCPQVIQRQHEHGNQQDFGQPDERE